MSWQVTGIRHDPYAEANPIVVEQEKPDHEKGTYLFPTVGAQSQDSSRVGEQLELRWQEDAERLEQARRENNIEAEQAGGQQ